MELKFTESNKLIDIAVTDENGDEIDLESRELPKKTETIINAASLVVSGVLSWGVDQILTPYTKAVIDSQPTKLRKAVVKISAFALSYAVSGIVTDRVENAANITKKALKAAQILKEQKENCDGREELAGEEEA